MKILDKSPQLTSFIGRADELAEITKLLADPTCRLLTLLGPGGIGKTRLAVQVTVELLDDFVHGVYFVPLQAIQSTDFLVSVIADAVPFSVSGQETPVFSYLTICVIRKYC